MSTEREIGIIREYFTLKGFGFIRRERGKDVFFFYTDLKCKDENIDIGDRVSFNVTKTPKGPRATLIKKEGSAI
ncbi:retron Se72 family effector protein [Methylocaldum sp.]|uniref:retron Se72 family effector protein n=1 Tax=Methylocaldum sp. TaxID=1969727 RepID=UPI002D31A939|nr:retron Se72 family effector protein [Methylocaldum sp.]HYE36064.1 retron Se72 family effector protein [Methylocaldum sp.]